MIIYQGLILNAALLILLGFFYSLIFRHLSGQQVWTQVLNGFLFGLVTLGVMLVPLSLAPGVVFDTRSVVLSVAGLFGGPIAATVSVAIASGFRILQGGVGALTGVLVAVVSGAIGVLFHYLVRRSMHLRTLRYYVFGIVVHVGMLLCMFTLPGSLPISILSKITIPVIFIYPVVTLLLCLLLADRERRISIEKQLAQSEQRYRELVEQLPVSVGEYDKDYNITFFNQEALRTFGYQEEDLESGTNIKDLLPLEEQNRLAKKLESLIRGNDVGPLEIRLAKKDGSSLFGIVHPLPVFEGNRVQSIRVIFHDMTEHRLAEEARRHSEESFSALVKASPLAIFSLDPDGKVTFWNPAAEQIFGWTADEVVGDILPIVPEDEMYQFKRYRERVLSGESFTGINLLRFNSDGQPIYVRLSTAPLRDKAGKPEGIMAVMADITQQKQAEQTILEGSARLELLNSISKDMLSGLEAELVVESALSKLQQMFPEYRVAYGTIDKDGWFKITHSWQPESMSSFAGMKVDLKEAPEYLAALRTLKPLPIADIASEPLVAPFAKVMRQGGNQSILDVPINLWDEPMGLICFDSPHLHEWSDHEISILREVSELLSIGYREQSSRYELESTQAVVEKSPAIIARWRPDAKWSFTYVSNNVAQLGYDPSELYGSDFGLKYIIHPKDLQSVSEEAGACVDGGDAHLQQEFRVLTRSGQMRWFDARINVARNHDGELTHYQGILLDITDRRQAERKADESIEHFRLLVESAPEAIFVQSDFKFAYLNPVAVKLFGAKSASELIGQPVMDRFPPEFHDKVKQRIMQLNEDRKPVGRLDQIYLKMDGTPFHVTTTAVPVSWEGKNGALVFFHDIGERIKAEEEKANLEEQLLQAQKLESVGRLAGGVAHDFNNLLGVVLGYAELALEDLSDQNPAYEALEQIHDAGHRAKNVARQLLAFGRKQVLQIKTVNLNEVVTGFDKMLSRLIGEDIVVETHLSPDLGLVKADPSMMEQILLNLAVNARDAMPDGGSLTIETDMVELDENYANARPGVQPGPHVMLAISDTGHGMDKETREKLFEPFFTTKPKGKGTGLGLSTVYGIVKQHGGNIWVYSEPGQGTTFKIYLPLSTQVMASPTTKAPSQKETEQGQETILLVEDDETLRAMVAKTLERSGYTVLIADDPEKAQSLLADQTDPVDLLLTDVVMPQMNGKALFESLAVERPDMKVLFMSGYTENVIAHRGVLDEGVEFIQKPFAVSALRSKVRQVLEK